jgi:hypothetical protein
MVVSEVNMLFLIVISWLAIVCFRISFREHVILELDCEGYLAGKNLAQVSSNYCWLKLSCQVAHFVKRCIISQLVISQMLY